MNENSVIWTEKFEFIHVNIIGQPKYSLVNGPSSFNCVIRFRDLVEFIIAHKDNFKRLLYINMNENS